VFLLIHKCQLSLNELFNDALKTFEVTLAFEERYKNMKCQVFKMLSGTISGRVQIGKFPRIWSVGFVSGSPNVS
jgi:hypothetical protein